MTRSVEAAMVTEITAGTVHPILLAKFAYDSGDINFWSGITTIDWNGDTYTGSGNFASISVVQETEDTVGNDLVFTVSGISAEAVSDALDEDYQGRAATLWFGALDSNFAVIADPIRLFNGLMDVMTIADDGQTANISIRCESHLGILDRPSPRAWTAEDQKSREPGDKGFDEVVRIQDDEIIWTG